MQKLNHIISKAKDVFTRSGRRLAEKRKHILECLLESNTPLFVYEIGGAHNKVSEKSMTIMSVYRILELFEVKSLVNKFNSANEYVACSHKSGDYTQEITQFFIYDKCQSSKEITVCKGIIDELSKLVGKVGYTLTNLQLELQCFCNNYREYGLAMQNNLHESLEHISTGDQV
jgi:Fur family zinc uptake transcriptional regulator